MGYRGAYIAGGPYRSYTGNTYVPIYGGLRYVCSQICVVDYYTDHEIQPKPRKIRLGPEAEHSEGNALYQQFLNDVVEIYTDY